MRISDWSSDVCSSDLGLYPAPPGASPILGLEVAGTIVAAGQNVPPGLVGQVVAALTPGGGYAEYCITNWRHCLPVPDHMPLAEELGRASCRERVCQYV